MTCGFKSHLPHQTKVPMAYPAMGIFVWYSELRTCCKGDRRLRRIQGAGAGAAVEEGKRHKTRSLIRAPQVGTGRRHRSAGTNSPVDCWLARGKVPSSAPKERAYERWFLRSFAFCEHTFEHILHFISRKYIAKAPRTDLTVLPRADIINIEKALRQAVSPIQSNCI